MQKMENKKEEVGKKSYPVTVRRLHWLMAVMIFTLLILGFYSSGLPMHGVQLEHMGRHAIFGSGLVLFAIIRLYTKIKNFKNNPHLPKKFAKFEKISAILTHYVFYILFLLMPLSGWLMINGLDIKLTFMGIPLPHIIPVAKSIGTYALYFHIIMVYAIIFLVFAHVVGTFWHIIKDKENLLGRLNPLMTSQEKEEYKLALQEMKKRDKIKRDQRKLDRQAKKIMKNRNKKKGM